VLALQRDRTEAMTGKMFLDARAVGRRGDDYCRLIRGRALGKEAGNDTAQAVAVPVESNSVKVSRRRNGVFL
jgi:hypothetical protein